MLKQTKLSGAAIMNVSKLVLNFANKRLINSVFSTSNSFNYSLQVGISRDKENLEVNIENNLEKFPLVWLRDNCTCDKCYHRESKSRIINWTDFNVDVKAKTVEVGRRNYLITALLSVNHSL